MGCADSGDSIMATLAHAGSGNISASTKTDNVVTPDVLTFAFDSPEPSGNDDPVT